ncbi:hypothetical protein ACFY72_35015 [Streptomyces globisporus]|uniref:hypothetical protein n=1 Tax=Streptomyces globisporus TaxID=1908 RepID=UPI0036852DB0
MSEMGWCDFWKEHLEDIPGNSTPAYCKAKDAVKDEVANAASSAWEEIVRDFQSGAVWMVKEVGLSWLRVDTPALSQSSGTVSFLFQHTLALTQWLAVLSLLLAAGHMLWTQRAEPAKQAMAGLLRLTIVSAAGVAVINLLTAAGDAFAVWIVNRSLGCDGGGAATDKCVREFGDQLAEMTTLGDLDQIIITLIVSLLLLLSGFVQLISLIIRQAMLFILVGTLPLAAAASGTEQGMGWWKKTLGWILAFVAFKPAAALAYAAGFSQFSTNKGETDVMAQLYGVTLLLLAALTLPALMRFIAPVVETAGTSGLGGGGGRGASTAARIASGAIALKTGGASTAVKAAGAAGASGSKGGGGASGSGQAGGSGGQKPPSGGGQKPPSGGSTPPASSGSGSAPGSTSAPGLGSTSGAGSTSGSGAATGQGSRSRTASSSGSGAGSASGSGSGGTRPMPAPSTSPTARTIPARPWTTRTPPRQGGPRGSN